MENTICHFEIPAEDMAGAQKFYAALFGWTITPVPGLEDEYLFLKTSEHPGALGGALMKKIDDRQLTVYINVSSIEETSKKLIDLGGSIIMPKTAIGTLGWAATAKDPQGNTIGLWQAQEQIA